MTRTIAFIKMTVRMQINSKHRAAVKAIFKISNSPCSVRSLFFAAVWPPFGLRWLHFQIAMVGLGTLLNVAVIMEEYVSPSWTCIRLNVCA